MQLELMYEGAEQLPKGFESLYEERDGKYQLTRINGLKTEADVTRQLEANRKEREAHAATKAKLREFEGIDTTTLRADLDELAELRMLRDGGQLKPGDPQIQQAIEAGVNKKLGPLTRERDQLKEELAQLRSEVDQHKTRDRQRTIADAARQIASEQKVRPEALDDVITYAQNLFEVDDTGKVVAKDGLTGVDPGLPLNDWLRMRQKTSPHWWPTSEGSGARGGGPGGMGDNPWSKESWNVTAQGRYVQEHGIEKAQAMAARAGVKIGATRPAA